MDGARWYAIYDNGEKIVEDDSLPRKGLLALDTKRIKEFGLESKNWNAYFTIEGEFFVNKEKVQSALPDKKIENFKIVCYHKVVLNDLAGNAYKQKYLVFGYKTKNEESSLMIAPDLLAYCFLRKRNLNGSWNYSRNNKIISSREYNILLHF